MTTTSQAWRMPASASRTNPRSNGKAGRGIARVEAMRAAGIPVGIGTDGPMSGNTLDLFCAIRARLDVPKLLGRIAQAAAGARGGPHGDDRGRARARAGRQDRLARTRQAGGSDPHQPRRRRLHPIYDPYSMLVFAADGRSTSPT